MAPKSQPDLVPKYGFHFLKFLMSAGNWIQRPQMQNKGQN